MAWTTAQCDEAYEGLLTALGHAGFSEVVRALSSEATLGDVVRAKVKRPPGASPGKQLPREHDRGVFEQKKPVAPVIGQTFYVVEVTGRERLLRLLQLLRQALVGATDVQRGAFDSLIDKRNIDGRIEWADVETGSRVHSIDRSTLEARQTASAVLDAALVAMEKEVVAQ